MSDPRLDHTDTDDARRTVKALRVALADIDATVRDMLAAPRSRQLGPTEHRRLYREAHDKAMAVLALMEPTDERTDPAGNGGSLRRTSRHLR